MNYSLLEENVEGFVTHVFGSPHRVLYPYHNLAHTKAVVGHVKEIGRFYALNEKDNCTVSVAAWFHDIGQLYGEMKDHEERGVMIMNNYLDSIGVSTELADAAGSCIMATKKITHPADLPQKIICDADTYHFGTLVFRETEFMMEKEMEMRCGHPFPHWHHSSIQLLRDHVFYTEYCQLLLAQGKKENIAWLESLVRSHEK